MTFMHFLELRISRFVREYMYKRVETYRKNIQPHKSKINWQSQGKKNYKRQKEKKTQHNTTYKTQNTSPKKTQVDLGCPRRISISCSTHSCSTFSLHYRMNHCYFFSENVDIAGNPEISEVC